MVGAEGPRFPTKCQDAESGPGFFPNGYRPFLYASMLLFSTVTSQDTSGSNVNVLDMPHILRVNGVGRMVTWLIVGDI